MLIFYFLFFFVSVLEGAKWALSQGGCEVSLGPLNLINQWQALPGLAVECSLIAHLCSHLFCLTCDGLNSVIEVLLLL